MTIVSNVSFASARLLINKKKNIGKDMALSPSLKQPCSGLVTAGEIGIIKKDLTFSGNVLNTTARIMTYCKEYQQQLIISGELYENVKSSPDNYSSKYLGEKELRGRVENSKLYGISKANSSSLINSGTTWLSRSRIYVVSPSPWSEGRSYTKENSVPNISPIKHIFLKIDHPRRISIKCYYEI